MGAFADPVLHQRELHPCVVLFVSVIGILTWLVSTSKKKNLLNRQIFSCNIVLEEHV